ncbi:MAG: nitrate transporter ATP-binding protein, partial [Hyphomicrobiales bacterium]|nr:nitrate transporter ATP-binding protein [Hyphomicrobiales bacterium]
MSDTSTLMSLASSDIAALRIERVSKSFDTAKGKVTAVDDVSLDIKPGEFISIIGPSGCGKSTLMNMVGGLIADFDGQI